MKSLKTLSLGLLAAAGLVGTASAATPTLHVVGSTAFRAPNTAAMIDYLSSHLASGSTHVYAGYNGSSLLGAGSAILANGTIGTSGSGSATIIIETFWTGSLAGVVDLVAANNTGAYIDPSTLTTTQLAQVNGSTVATNPYGGGVSITGTITTVTSAPDVAFSDSYQGTIAKELATGSFAAGTTHVGSFTSISSLATACAGSTVIDGGTSGKAKDAGFIGIVPFEWVVGNITAGTSSYANISQQVARSLIQTGFIPQSYLTGGNSSADTGNYFYLVGRNEDSGTRIGALSETQFGVSNSPTQYAVAGGSGTSTTGTYPISALNTEPGIIWNAAGHSGYATGGNVQGAIDIAESSTPFSFSGQSGENSAASYFIGYLGLTDASAAVTGGGKALNYNGVPFSVAAVQNGQYTFWTYEHSYHLATLASPLLAVADGIADNVYLTDADVAGDGKHNTSNPTDVAAGILDTAPTDLTSPVLVFRSVIEGGPISNY